MIIVHNVHNDMMIFHYIMMILQKGIMKLHDVMMTLHNIVMVLLCDDDTSLRYDKNCHYTVTFHYTVQEWIHLKTNKQTNKQKGEGEG